MKYLLLLLSLPLLFACTTEPIDFKHANVANDLFYSKKSGKPFTGTITNVPYKTFAQKDFWLSFNTYISFLTGMQDLDFQRSHQTDNDKIYCNIEVKNGVLNGQTECQLTSAYRVSLRSQDYTQVIIDSSYKDGSITESSTYRMLNDKKIKVMSTIFNGIDNTNYDIKVFSINQPKTVLLDIKKRPDKTIIDQNTHTGNLLTHTELTETTSHIDHYVPNTTKKIGTLTFKFKGDSPSFIPEERNGYDASYNIYPDSPNVSLNGVKFFKDGFIVSSKSYEEDEAFDLAEFNQQITETIKSWERLANYKPDNRVFSEIIFERQQLERQQAEAETLSQDETDPY